MNAEPVTPEAIVRAIAAADPVVYRGDYHYVLCSMCGVEKWPRFDVDEHKPDCPWRLAAEWVAARSEAKKR